MLVSDKYLLLIHINLFAVLLDRFLHQRARSSLQSAEVENLERLESLNDESFDKF
ncbi:hypothetical protein NC981_20695 [Leptolyngbya sp. DQ-M1]|uniref:hypothetical protein n=1 Tax=Leptolyngbya sp. DQ-M1 TaxID=2933920 RepID=UPI003297D756